MKKLLAITILLLLIALPVIAADQTLYVRDGASGTGTGADWTNACEELSLCEAKVDRATYDNVYIYVADGNYAGRIVFDAAENGTRMVYIYKATVAEHGTETGWDNAYGDGQAVINTGLVSSTYQQGIAFRTGFYELNGKSGTGSDYSTYGFKVIPSDTTHSEQLIGLPILGHASSQVDNITIKYVAMVNTGIGDGSKGRFGIYSIPSAGNNSYNITVSNCYFSGGHVNIYPLYAHHWIIENSYFADNWSSSANHGEQIAPRNCDDFIIRNNIFKNTSLYVVGSHCVVSGDRCNFRYKIYNNIVDGMAEGTSFNSAFGNATVSYANTNIQWEVHHNTILNVDFTNTTAQGLVFTGYMGDVETDHHNVYNNLFYNCTNPRLNHLAPYTAGQVVHDNNAFMACTAGSGGEIPTETNGQVDADAPSTIFTNYAGGDYTINASDQTAIDHIIGKGKTDLDLIYKDDAAGNERDATPDIGAFEAGASADTTPPTITSATINAAGDTLTIVFSEIVSVTTSTGFTLNMNGGAAGLTYSSGSGTNSLVYLITGRNIDTAETGTLDYVTVANGIEDASGNDLASTGESDIAVTNNSTYSPSATTYTVTPSVSSGGCFISPATPQAVVSGETKQFTCTAMGNYACTAWTGTCGGSGTNTLTTSAITGDCTVVQPCKKRAADIVIY